MGVCLDGNSNPIKAGDRVRLSGTVISADASLVYVRWDLDPEKMLAAGFVRPGNCEVITNE